MDIKKQLKTIIKSNIQSLASYLGRHKWCNKSPQLLILMYHRILPPEDIRNISEEPGMIVTPDTFRKHINILSDYFEFITLSDWLERKNNNSPLPNKACAITFDDGWLDNYEYAFPILEQTKTPATIFLVSKIINTTKVLWPERLARIINYLAKEKPDEWENNSLKWLRNINTSYGFSTNAPSREQLTEIIAGTKKHTEDEINKKLDLIETHIKLNDITKPSFLNWQQVNEMIDSGFVDIGSHTCNHIRLNDKASNQIISEEIINSKIDIEKNTNKSIKVFCYPNGDYSDEAIKIVKQHYIGAVTTDKGWNNELSDEHTLQRVAIHEDISNSTNSFLSRISGWT